ncbi:MAG: ABC transporter permease [Planctomycetia bacterium]
MKRFVESWRGSNPVLAPLLGLGLVALAAVLWGLSEKPDSPFLSGFRVALVLKQSAIVATGALGMTLVIAAGGIDLAIGSLLALCSVVLAKSLQSGHSGAEALLLAIGTGVAAGVVHGLLVTRGRLAPFIATLGTMLLWRGAAEEVSAQKKLSAEAPSWLASLLDPPGAGDLLPVATGVVLVLVAALAMAWMLARTVLGRRIYAIGSNEAAARLCGVPIAATKVLVYALMGFFAAAAGVLEFNNLNSQGNPSSGAGYELDVIAAVVLGGGSLSGGKGSIAGSLLGALLMTTLRSACVYAEVPDPLQKVLVGAIILVAVALDRWREGAR